MSGRPSSGSSRRRSNPTKPVSDRPQLPPNYLICAIRGTPYACDPQGKQFRAMKTQKRLFGFFAALALASGIAAFAQTPPANDDFANRTILTGTSISFTGSLAGATMESSETNSSHGFYWLINKAGSVWWTWTAPASSTVVVMFSGPQWPHDVITAYSGTDLNSLTPLDSTQYTDPAGRYARFNATSGISYQIQVAGSNSLPFSVQLTTTNPPVFIFEPQDCIVSPYGSAIFSAMATGPQPGYNAPSTTYQWLFNGVPIPGQTFPSLLVHGVTTNQAGSYSVIASNIGGTTQSGAAALTVADTNPVPQIVALQPTNSSRASFSLTGEARRWYKVESTGDLQDWVGWAIPTWLQLTNTATLVSIQRLAPNHFVRASLDVPTEVCVAQLKQMRWAIRLFMIEHKSSQNGTTTLENIRPYLPIDSNGSPPFCPGYGTYVSAFTGTNNPTCTFQYRGHLITDAP
jgi:hypothetical protein